MELKRPVCDRGKKENSCVEEMNLVLEIVCESCLWIIFERRNYAEQQVIPSTSKNVSESEAK